MQPILKIFSNYLSKYFMFFIHCFIFIDYVYLLFPKKLVMGRNPFLSLLICIKCLSNNNSFTLSEQYFSFFLINVSKSGYSFCKFTISDLYFLIALILFWFFHISSKASPKNWQSGFINWLLT